MKHPLSISLLAIFATGCTASKQTNNNDSADDSFDNFESDEPGNTPDPADTPSDDVQAEALFEVRGGAYDITLAPDGRIFVSIQEHGITVWDPVTNYPETYTERAGAVFGIAWAGDTIMYTTSLHRQEGTLSRLDGTRGTVIASASGSTIFREPTDLVQAPDGAWVLSDRTLETLFVVRDDGETVTMMDVDLEKPSCLTADDDYVYAGGLNGVVRIPWPGGTPEKIDERPVNGLHRVNGDLLGSNVDWGVFRVGEEERLGFDEVALPGRIEGETRLYVTDWDSSEVWASLP
jgi:hypothetical protein